MKVKVTAKEGNVRATGVPSLIPFNVNIIYIIHMHLSLQNMHMSHG